MSKNRKGQILSCVVLEMQHRKYSQGKMEGSRMNLCHLNNPQIWSGRNSGCLQHNQNPTPISLQSYLANRNKLQISALISRKISSSDFPFFPNTTPENPSAEDYIGAVKACTSLFIFLGFLNQTPSLHTWTALLQSTTLPKGGVLHIGISV